MKIQDFSQYDSFKTWIACLNTNCKFTIKKYASCILQKSYLYIYTFFADNILSQLLIVHVTVLYENTYIYTYKLENLVKYLKIHYLSKQLIPCGLI